MDAAQVEAQIANLMAQTAKLNAETGKISAETRWYPMVVAVAFVGAIIALTKIFL